MDDEACKTLQPEPGLTLQQAATLVSDGWSAARENLEQGGNPRPGWLDGMHPHWREGWKLFNSVATQTKMLRLGLLH